MNRSFGEQRVYSSDSMGHLIEPYVDNDAPPELPVPQVPLSEIGVKRWQHDFWLKIIRAVLDGHPDQVSLDWHPSLTRPAAQRYAASSPNLLNWLKKWNEGRPYSGQIRPFGFLLNYTPRTGVFLSSIDGELIDKVDRGRPTKCRTPKPTAPFNSDPDGDFALVFDRETGERVGAKQLKTYSEVLAQYHLSPEGKFENGRFLDFGRTDRRHVVAFGLVMIGKEANRVGECGETDPESEAAAEYNRNRASSSS